MQLNLEKRNVAWLKGNVQRVNICEDFDENTLNAIGQDVLKWHEIDDESRSEWKEQVQRGMDVAKQVVAVKNTPWPNCANAKDPLIAEAAMNFAARAMAEVVRGKDVIKTEVVGEDPEGQKEARAKRVGAMLSYQVLKQQPEWRPDTDQLLTSLPIIGMYYKKTYRDTINGRNVSCALSPMDVVVHNDTKTLALADRIGWEFKRNRNFVLEQIRNGVWADIEDKLDPDEDCPMPSFVEQQCYYDLDDDGYKEPYLITVHRESGAVARICVCYDEDGIVVGKSQDDEGGQKVLSIKPVEYYTEFGFMLQPDGTFHKMGFAQLLGSITELVNTMQNQLIDSGTLANRRPGFIGKGAKLPSGGVRFQLGQLTPVDVNGQDLRSQIVFPDFQGPSDVLFKMLELLLERGHKLASISEGMQGETGGANVPATTTLALLDQALKVYTSVLWRQYYSFDAEFKKLYRLNSLYLSNEEYQKIVDDPAANVETDFNMVDCDIEPVMDPRSASEALRLARLKALVEAAAMPPAIGRIYLTELGIKKSYIDTIFPQEQAPAPEAVKLQAEITKMQHESEMKSKEIELKLADAEIKDAKAVWEIEKMKAEVVEIKARSIKALAEAEAAEIGTQVGIYKAEMDQINTEAEQEAAQIEGQKEAKEANDNGDDGDSAGQQEPAQGVAEPQGDQGDLGAPEGEAAIAGADLGAGAGELGPADGGSVMEQSFRSDSGARPSIKPSQLSGHGPMQ